MMIRLFLTISERAFTIESSQKILTNNLRRVRLIIMSRHFLFHMWSLIPKETEITIHKMV